MFLAGLGRHLRRDGDGLLGAAGRRVLGRGEDLGPVAVEFHRVRAERAADLAHDRGAHDAVVAVGVVAVIRPSLCRAELGGLLVVGGGLLGGGVAGQRPEFQQRAWGGRAVQVPVGDDGAVVGAAGSAVEGCRSWIELGPGLAERDGPGFGVAVGVAGVGQDVAERDAGAGIAVSTGTRARAGSAGRRTGSSGGPARARPGRAPRASWCRPTGSSRRTARRPGRAGCWSGVPRTLRGRRSRVVPCGGGRDQVSTSVQSTASAVLASLNSAGMLASSRSSQIAARVFGGQAVGRPWPARGDEVKGALGLAVGQLVRAVVPVLGHAEPGLVGPGSAVSAWRTRVRCAGR